MEICHSNNGKDMVGEFAIFHYTAERYERISIEIGVFA